LVFGHFLEVEQLINLVQHRYFVDELGTGIDVEEYSISKQAGSGEIAWPHFKIVLRNLPLFRG
jgi:hypothetical protein